jgi:ERCC4-related helicase
MNDIITIKLVTGEEVIGRQIHKDQHHVTLEKPVQLAVTQQGLGFAPVCISIDDASEFKFRQDHILFLAPTRKELVDQYIKATTGIQLATSIK